MRVVHGVSYQSSFDDKVVTGCGILIPIYSGRCTNNGDKVTCLKCLRNRRDRLGVKRVNEMRKAEHPKTSIKLISMTQPEVIVENKRLTPEQLIEYTARVSNPEGQKKYNTSYKLLKYLLDHNHVSPLEMVDFTVEIETSRAIAAQILRHWSFSFQEFSQRYAKASEYVEYQARRQDPENRQNSIDDISDDDKLWFSEAQLKVWTLAKEVYDEALERGIAKEQARFVLPLNTKTRLYMKGNVRDWYFYLKLREKNGTQREHSDIAKGIINDVMKVRFPIVSQVAGWL